MKLSHIKLETALEKNTTMYFSVEEYLVSLGIKTLHYLVEDIINDQADSEGERNCAQIWS